ncbi:ribbon-helix-helix domain-containing protein [Nostoc sp.]
MEQQTVRTTLILPKDLLEATDKAIESGKAKSRNEFVTRGLRRELAAEKRAEIDAALAEIANDLEYQREVLQMEAEFAPPQWEALKLEINRSPY